MASGQGRGDGQAESGAAGGAGGVGAGEALQGAGQEVGVDAGPVVVGVRLVPAGVLRGGQVGRWSGGAVPAAGVGSGGDGDRWGAVVQGVVEQVGDRAGQVVGVDAGGEVCRATQGHGVLPVGGGRLGAAGAVPGEHGLEVAVQVLGHRDNPPEELTVPPETPEAVPGGRYLPGRQVRMDRLRELVELLADRKPGGVGGALRGRGGARRVVDGAVGGVRGAGGRDRRVLGGLQGAGGVRRPGAGLGAGFEGQREAEREGEHRNRGGRGGGNDAARRPESHTMIVATTATTTGTPTRVRWRQVSRDPDIGWGDAAATHVTLLPRPVADVETAPCHAPSVARPRRAEPTVHLLSDLEADCQRSDRAAPRGGGKRSSASAPEPEPSVTSVNDSR